MFCSLKATKSIPPDYAFEEFNKKKSKKLKKGKLDKNKKAKRQQTVKNDTYTQMPKIKKMKNKNKKNDAELNEELSLLQTQNKKPKLSNKHKKTKDHSHAVGMCKFKSIIQPEPGEHEPTKPALEKHKNSALKHKDYHKRKVMFNLSPEDILSKPQATPFAQRDQFQTQPSCAERLASLNVVLSGDGKHCNPCVEENGVASQSTPEDINSQDLFITQKFFLDTSVEICSNASTDGASVPPYQESTQCTFPSPEMPSCKQTADASSQTENFFTSPVHATSFKFHLQTTESICIEEPMDLSLPNRSRHEGLHQWHIKPPEHHRHPELKITDITSSNESDILSKGKAGLPQMKVVQTRLNESFFFKMKGMGESPKQTFPLMTLTGSVKSAK